MINPKNQRLLTQNVENVEKSCWVTKQRLRFFQKTVQSKIALVKISFFVKNKKRVPRETL